MSSPSVLLRRHSPFGRWSAATGFLVWLGLTAGSATHRVPLDIISVLFLLAPLVVVPLGLQVADRSNPIEPIGLFDRLARVTQPAGAILAVLSFLVPAGLIAAGLASGWLLVCSFVSLAGLARLMRGAASGLEDACFAVAAFYLSAGGVWLALSRAGARPLHFAEPIVLLTAVHFHFSGFALPLIASRAASLAGRRNLELQRASRVIVMGILAGPALLAAGFVLSPGVKLAAALLLVLSCLGLAGLFMSELSLLRSRAARTLLILAALSLASAMTLAGFYAVGEFTARNWLLIPQMARWHGVLNGAGFTVLGLVAWTFEP